jgi:hypothetical protein
VLTMKRIPHPQGSTRKATQAARRRAAAQFTAQGRDDDEAALQNVPTPNRRLKKQTGTRKRTSRTMREGTCAGCDVQFSAIHSNAILQ